MGIERWKLKNWIIEHLAILVVQYWTFFNIEYVRVSILKIYMFNIEHSRPCDAFFNIEDMCSILALNIEHFFNIELIKSSILNILGGSILKNLVKSYTFVYFFNIVLTKSSILNIWVVQYWKNNSKPVYSYISSILYLPKVQYWTVWVVQYWKTSQNLYIRIFLQYCT